MICKFCGNEIEDGSDFCFICGQKIEADAPVKEEANAPAAAPAEAEAAVAVAPPEAQEPAVEAAPAVPLDPKAAKKAAKKARAGGFAKFISCIIPLIGLLLYRSAKKKGYEKKAVSLLNATMVGVNLYMVVILAVLVKKYMFA